MIEEQNVEGCPAILQDNKRNIAVQLLVSK
jgi:hypothetical protein